MPSAIVTGATGEWNFTTGCYCAHDLYYTPTGILGRAIVQHLQSDPSKWNSIHALSRSQKEVYPPNVKHAHVDLSADAGQLSAALQGIEGEYLFFAAYLQGETEQENWDINGMHIFDYL